MTHGALDRDSVFRTLFSAYPDAMLLVDMAGTVVLANPSAADLLGYSEGELNGLPVDALVPDSIRPRHAAYREAYARNPRPRPMGTQMELAARRRDGSEVVVEIALSPLQEQGLPYVVASIRDIGSYPRVKQALQRARHAEAIAQMSRLAVDMREAEPLLRQVPVVAAEALQVEVGVLYLLQPDGQSFRVAGGLGLTAGEAPGTLVPNLPHTPPGHVLQTAAPVVVADYRSESRFTTPPAYLADGLVSGLGVPLLERGRVIGALSVRSRQRQRFGEDETRFLQSLANLVATALQRVQTEEALQHAQRLETVGQLTGGIAHDFNNLLTVIHGNLQVLEELPAVAGDDFAQQLVHAAERATRRGAELTGKLLAFSRRQVLKPHTVDLGTLLPSLADMLRRTLDQRVRIGVEIEPDCPPCRADPGQLESALLNIAINARDAMPDGGQLLFKARRATLPPALAAELAQEDPTAITGTGMPESVKERAFEPFFTTKEAGRGTGLGLSTVYGFARQSHGGATIDSAPGEGTTITLYIPADLQEAAPRGEGPASGQPVPPGLRVLLVEDDAEVRTVVRNFLDGFGCRVTACASGEQALALLAQPDEVDLLLSDIALGPGMRGTQLAHSAQKQRPQLAVLLMSGYSSDLLDADRDSPPGWELLRKPYGRDELARAIVRVLGARA
ncbi:PAS domain S-box protein [Aquabacterium sp.]|uniref:PAS domain S-box protein n=1 Tax=Aquabacterium sp. TaxID=1872578 RepID=UPI003783DD75